MLLLGYQTWKCCCRGQDFDRCGVEEDIGRFGRRKIGCVIKNSRMERLMSNQTRTKDPKKAGPQPPFPEQEQDPVGLESEMEPRPDYGEESYRGSGKLQGKAAVITGGDSGI